MGSTMTYLFRCDDQARSSEVRDLPRKGLLDRGATAVQQHERSPSAIELVVHTQRPELHVARLAWLRRLSRDASWCTPENGQKQRAQERSTGVSTFTRCRSSTRCVSICRLTS